MKLSELWRSLWPEKQPEAEPPFDSEDDPFNEPVVLEITDTIDLHSIPPKQVKEIVEEYLLQAHARGFAVVFVQHPGSDESVWKDLAAGGRLGALREAASAKNFALRVKDIPAVLDQLARWNAEAGHENVKRAIRI